MRGIVGMPGQVDCTLLGLDAAHKVAQTVAQSGHVVAKPAPRLAPFHHQVAARQKIHMEASIHLIEKLPGQQIVV